MTIAYKHETGSSPGVLFLPGFNSSMLGNKAERLDQFCQSHGVQYTRFDYTGHGDSSGEFEHGTITQWRNDTLELLDTVCTGPQILVGSSMGGWIAALTAALRPQRVAGLLGIASAPDFTNELIEPRLSEATLAALARGEAIELPNHYDDGTPHRIRQALLDSGRLHSVLNQPMPINCPVRLLHGTEDTDVPWSLSQRLLECVTSENAQLRLVKGVDHRFSEPQHLEIIEHALLELLPR